MKTVGIIAEYNPFHNGHLYHLEEAKRVSSADSSVCIMSGNFIQRGEPAMVSKWARARAALQCGADLVLELPVIYAMSSAEFFAFGGVRILDSLGIVNALCFGSESGNLVELQAIADVLADEPEPYSLYLKESLGKGLSFPSARQEALELFIKNSAGVSDGIRSILAQSNNILGIEYLKALKKLGSSIIPITIPRLGNAYRSEEITGSISSATAIRKHILDGAAPGHPHRIPAESLPAQSLHILESEFASGRGPVYPASFESVLLALIRRMSAQEVASLPYVSEGLENRVKEAADTSGTLEEMLDKISTRRYPRTRIRRILFSILAGFTGRDLDLFNKNGGPQYIRVLGFNSRGRELLASIRKKATLPIITKPANFKNSGDPLVERMLEIESRSTDIYVLSYQNTAFRSSGQEYTSQVVRI